MTTPTANLAQRASLIADGAAQWRDPASDVRFQARETLAGGAWSEQTIEIALDNVLWDLDEARVVELAGRINPTATSNVLVVLPGNVIGPAIQTAYCAAIAGARVTLKAAHSEPYLAEIVSRQFHQLGGPLRDCAKAVYWPSGDTAAEARAYAGIQRVIVFGENATVDQIRSRAPAGVECVGYGESHSVGFVHADADLTQAAARATLDICLFDQRGCMSPQTIYVEGDAGRALLFARTLAREIESMRGILPRAAFAPGERDLLAGALRRFAATALEPMPHGLDTLIQGPLRDSLPEFVVAVEPFGPPSCAGFGRIVVVQPCSGARDVVTQLKRAASVLDTVGVATGIGDHAQSAFRLANIKRVCELGEMQRPPVGYRPALEDFLQLNSAS